MTFLAYSPSCRHLYHRAGNVSNGIFPSSSCQAMGKLPTTIVGVAQMGAREYLPQQSLLPHARTTLQSYPRQGTRAGGWKEPRLWMSCKLSKW